MLESSVGEVNDERDELDSSDKDILEFVHDLFALHTAVVDARFCFVVVVS